MISNILFLKIKKGIIRDKKCCLFFLQMSESIYQLIFHCLFFVVAAWILSYVI